MLIRSFVIFVGFALASMQLGIVEDEYGKSLTSHYLESQRAADLFREDANTFFDGDMAALISHYKSSNDLVFTKGGFNIEKMYGRYLMLKRAVEGYQGDRFVMFKQIAFHAVNDVREEVLRRFNFTVRLESSLLYFSTMCGLFGIVSVEIILNILGAAFRGTNTSRFGAASG